MSNVVPIRADEFARIAARVYEPDLDWDNPGHYDLLDRDTLTAAAFEILKELQRVGIYVVRKRTADDMTAQDLDDLCLDEFDLSPGSADRGSDD